MGNSNAPAQPPQAQPSSGQEQRKALTGAQQRQRLAERKRIVAHLDPHRPIHPDSYVPEDDVAMVFARNPLCDAVALCDEPLVSNILAAGRIDVNVLSEDGESALHVATRRGHVRIVELLLKAGARVNGPDRFGFTPLHHAIQCDLVQARALIDTFFPAAWPSSSVAASARLVAASNEALMTMLLEYGAWPHATSRDGTTCLHFALRLRKIAESVLLMKHADVAAHIGMEAQTAIGETPLHLLAALGVVNLLDAALKTHFYALTRPKAEAVSAGKDYQMLAKRSSLRAVEAVYHDATQCGATGAKLSAPKWHGAVPCLHPETMEEAIALSRACYVARLPAPRRMLPDATPPTTFRGDAAIAQVGIAFPIAIARRETPSLNAMVGSDRFRNQGLVPLGNGQDADVLLWTPANVADTERGYCAEVPRIIRSVVLHELGLAIVRSRERAASAAAGTMDRPIPGGLAATGGGAAQFNTKALLTFDLFVEMLDALDQPHTQQQQQPQTNQQQQQAEEADGNPVTEGAPHATRSIADIATESGTAVPSAVKEVGSVPTNDDDRIRPEQSTTRRAGSLSLRSKMALVLGDAAPTRVHQPRIPSCDDVNVPHDACTVTADDLLALLPIGPMETAAMCPLDVAIRSGPMFGRTPLFFCNGNNTVTPLNEKRCAMMLLAVRTQLLAEETFGMLCGDQ